MSQGNYPLQYAQGGAPVPRMGAPVPAHIDCDVCANKNPIINYMHAEPLLPTFPGSPPDSYILTYCPKLTSIQIEELDAKKLACPKRNRTNADINDRAKQLRIEYGEELWLELGAGSGKCINCNRNKKSPCSLFCNNADSVASSCEYNYKIMCSSGILRRLVVNLLDYLLTVKYNLNVVELVVDDRRCICCNVEHRKYGELVCGSVCHSGYTREKENMLSFLNQICPGLYSYKNQIVLYNERGNQICIGCGLTEITNTCNNFSLGSGSILGQFCSQQCKAINPVFIFACRYICECFTNHSIRNLGPIGICHCCKLFPQGEYFGVFCGNNCIDAIIHAANLLLKMYDAANIS